MTSFLESLERRRTSPIAKAHQIRLYLSDANGIALITEAPDDEYFLNCQFRKIRHISGLRTFAATGKSNAIEIFRLVQLSSHRHRCFVVIDRDFDFGTDFEFEQNAFCIDVYSIENYFIDEVILADFFVDYFSLSLAPDFEIDLHTRVKQFLSDVCDVFSEPHVLAICAKLMGVRCLLANVDVTRLISVSSGGQIVPYAEYIGRFRDASDIAHFVPKDDVFRRARAIVEQRPAREWMRGHYFFVILVKWLDALRRELDGVLRKRRLNRTRTRADLTSRQVFDALVNFMPVPKCVRAIHDRIAAAPLAAIDC